MLNKTFFEIVFFTFFSPCRIYVPMKYFDQKSQHQKTFLWTCAPSEDSDQPRMKSFFIRTTKKTLMKCADALADLSLRLAPMSEDWYSHVAVHMVYGVGSI